LAKMGIRRRYMALWVRRAWRSFRKIDSVRKIGKIQTDLRLKQHF